MDERGVDEKPDSPNRRTLDDVLSILGDLGPFQIRILIMLNLCWVCSQLFMTMPAFDLAIPKHRCRISPDDTYTIQNAEHRHNVQRYIPKSSSDLQEYSQCQILKYDANTNISSISNTSTSSWKVKCDSWVYDKGTFDSTFVSEKDLVCDSRFMRSSTNFAFYAGVLVGSFVFGVVSDLCGRRQTSLISLMMMITLSLTLAFQKNYYAFTVVRFLLGLSLPGMFMSIYVLLMEWTGPSKRRLVIIVAGIISSVGESFMVLLAYLVRHRKYLQITITVPVVAFTIAVFFILPESPRWLMARKRKDEAKELLQRAANVNKKDLSDDVLADLRFVENKETGRVYLLFTNWRLAVRTLIIFYCWMVGNMVFYGLILNSENLYGDFYINMLIFAITSLLGNALPYLLVDRVGRRRTLSWLMALGGFSCLSTIFTVQFGGSELQPLTTALAMFGRLCAGGAYLTIYLSSAELFPTVVRNAGLGASSCSARIGSMLSPFVGDSAMLVSGKGGQAIPLVIFGGITLIGAGLSMFLPETMGKKLPETLEDAANIGRENSNSEDQLKGEDGVNTETTKF